MAVPRITIPYGLKTTYLQRMLAGFLLAAAIYLYDIAIPLPGSSALAIHLPLIMGLFFLIGMKRQDIFFFMNISFVLILFTIIQNGFYSIPSSPSRMYSGIFMFITLMVCTARLWDISREHGHQQFFLFCRWLFRAHLVIQICGTFLMLMTGQLVQASYIPGLPRSFGFAGESSHVGVILAPLIFLSVTYPSVFSKYFGGKISHALLFISVFFLAASATGVAIYALAFVCRLIVRKSLLPLFLGAPLVLAMIFLIPQIYARITGILTLDLDAVSRGDNFSVLVFAKGAEMALAALEYYPFGVGMLNFQELLPYSLVAKLGPPLDTLNNFDGSSLLFKGVGEFGYAFLLLYLLSLWKFFRSIATERTPSLDIILQNGFIFAFLIAALRGGSYFTGPAMVGLSLTLYTVLTRSPASKRESRSISCNP